MRTEKLSTELIKLRTSTRSFDNEEVESTKFAKLNDYIENINKQSKIKARFILATNKNDSKDAKKLGTYGIISGANSFIIGILDKDEKDSVEFGYLFEKIVLFATDLDLGTCWLGGTFKKENFENNIELGDDEFIPIVSPVGNKREKPKLFDKVMRAGAGSDKRKPWNELFFQGESLVPLTEAAAGSYSIPLEMVRLGPSASNKQPWRIVKDKDNFHLFLSRTKGYGLTSYDLQKNDMGIAKCHFELVANELGLKGSWKNIEAAKLENDWEYICTWCGEK